MFPIRSEVQSGRALITWGLCCFLLICVVMQSLTTISSAALFRSFGFVPARMMSPVSWSLVGPLEQVSSTITYVFVHDGVWHALFNIWFLGVFGGPIEGHLGPVKYVVSLMLFVVSSALIDLAIRPHSVVPLVGASGLVAGLMGFFLVAYPRSRLLTVLPMAVPFPIKIPIFWFMLVWLSLQLAVLLDGPSTEVQSAWWIHLAGFILGCLCGLISATPMNNQRAKTQS